MNIAALTQKAMSVVPADLKKSVTFTLGELSIAGTAMQDVGGYRSYLAQGLITENNEVVFFVPATAGQCPKEGYTLVGFGDGDLMTTKVFPIAPNGVVIAARVAVSR